MLLKRIILFLLIILSLVNVEPAECIENVGNRYGIGATIIEGVVTGPPPYTTQNTFYPINTGQCTAFAWGRALDRLGIITTFSQASGRHACTWPDIITNTNILIETDYTKPKTNSFIIWGYEDPCNEDSTGHVAYVEEVDENYVYINEANIATYAPGEYGGGYDGFTKKLTISEINSRTGVGGPFKAYVCLNNPFSNYWYWDFEEQGTEDWNARKALNQGIYQDEYWQIGTSFEDDSVKRGVVSPILNNINTDQYKAIEIRFGIKNMFLGVVDVYFKINNGWIGPFTMNWADGSKDLGSQNVYKCNIPVTGQIQQVRIDFDKGSKSIDKRIYIDYVKFLTETTNLTLLSQTIGPPYAKPGDRLMVYYAISDPTFYPPSNIRLGVRIRKSDPQGDWIDDPANDRTVSQAGRSGDIYYFRYFYLPETMGIGVYDVEWVILDNTTEQWLDSKDELNRLHIILPTAHRSGDINNDDRVNVTDLGILLSNWGSFFLIQQPISIRMVRSTSSIWALCWLIGTIHK